MGKKEDNTDRILFIYGAAALISELIKQLFLYNVNGFYDWWYFPFQLCSVPMYVCLLLLALKSAESKNCAVTFIAEFALLCGAAAFLDTTGMHYPYPWLTVHSYLWHIGLIAIGIIAGMSSGFIPGFKSYLKTLGIFFFCCFIATLLNTFTSGKGYINMFYISPFVESGQIIIRDINNAVGLIPGHIIYIASICAGAYLVNVLFSLLNPLRSH